MTATKWTWAIVTTFSVLATDEGTAEAARRVYKRGWFGREVYREHWLGDAGAGVLTHLITTAGTVGGNFLSGSGGGGSGDGDSGADAEESARIEAHNARGDLMDRIEDRTEKMADRLGIKFEDAATGGDASSDDFKSGPGGSATVKPDRKSKSGKRAGS